MNTQSIFNRATHDGIVLLVGTLVALITLASFVIAKECEYKYRDRKGVISPGELDQYISLSDAEIEETLMAWEDFFLDAVPSVLLMIGLLGTFLGLTQAISAAGEAIGQVRSESSQLFESLVRVLSGMGVKFLSSVFGISGYLATRFFGGFLSRMPRRKFARELRRAAAARQVEKLNAIVASLEVLNQVGELSRELKGAAMEVEASTTRLVDATTELSTRLDSNASQLGAFTAQLAATIQVERQALEDATKYVQEAEQAARRMHDETVTGLCDAIQRAATAWGERREASGEPGQERGPKT